MSIPTADAELYAKTVEHVAMAIAAHEGSRCFDLFNDTTESYDARREYRARARIGLAAAGILSPQESA